MPDNPNLKSNPIQAHQVYCRLTGYQIDFTMQRLYAWEPWCLKFDEKETALIIQHNQRKGRYGRSLLFHNFIGGPNSVAFAEEDLQEIRQRKPARLDPGKERVLRSTGRDPEPKQAEAKPVGDVMKESAKLAAMLRQFRSEL